ncbi:ParA family protein [uncultured Adlercreutzia sp.]|uniref:nucleotide-binding protein n=1 Tax=uncultured Adlercreutzia sp. TaxID=875803 RepID=UPI00267535A9|nr:ParA family protein [uncultured Adlercreutzia sp.]
MARAGEVPFALAPVTVVVGHYGVGKTNFALNLALDAAAAGYEVTLADMDVVNPYFRSSEYAGLLEEAGVRLIAPVFGGAGTSLDVPSLTGAVVPAIEAAYAEDAAGAPGAPRKAVVIDAGGDDVGATALARFAPAIRAGRHEVLYVVNARRNRTQTPDEAAAVLAEIQAKCGLAATAVVNNTHLQGETTLGHIAESVPFAQAVAAKAGVPVACTTVPKSAIRRESDPAPALSGLPGGYPVEVLVAPPWA